MAYASRASGYGVPCRCLYAPRNSSGTAILDVLIPPYDEGAGRDCTYYRPEANEAAGVRLVPCSPGNHFRVVRGDFVPPFPM